MLKNCFAVSATRGVAAIGVCDHDDSEHELFLK
jgi:hypothetical protein